MGKLKLKVCGLKDAGNIRNALSVRPDFIGFIFHKHSPRYIGMEPPFGNTFEIPPDTIKTGVFVNENSTDINRIAERFGLGALQLHGHESPALCDSVRTAGRILIKVFSVRAEFDFSALEPYHGVVDYFMFDTGGPNYGGNGKSFDWKLLEKYPYRTPFFLSGGIGNENVEEIRKISNPAFFAVDINSRVESSPGIKDISKLKLFRQKFDKINL